jgi:cytochrome P450
MRRDPLAFLTRLRDEHGDLVTFRVGGERMLLASHPDHVREILVTQQRNFRKGRGLERARLLLGDGLLTSEGEHHLRQRRLAQPAFHRARVVGYARTMATLGERTAANWTDGQRFDVHDEMMRLTLAIVGKTLFDAEVGGAEAGAIGEALDQAFASFGLAMLPMGELLARLPLPAARRFRAARERLDATVYRIIAERRAGGDDDRGDLLSMLMTARDEEADAAGDPASRGMSDLQLRDELLTIFLAGHETTANALTWTLHLLAQHPEAEAALHRELDDVLGGPGGRAVEADDVARLPYARQVVAESMRLYPPAWVIGRRAVEPFEIGGFRVPARTVVLTSQWLVHRDARWFERPEAFDPSRWAPAAAAERHRFSYFPFGAGTRVCIGEQFAWTEAVLLLAAVARRWRLRLEPGELARVTPEPIVTLRPRGGVRMRVEAR